MNNKQNNPVPNRSDTPVPTPPPMQFLARPDIQTLFIDKFVFTKRPDRTLIASGIQGVPGMEIEQLRFLITEDHAKNFLDILAKLLDYYPAKETKQEVLVKQSTKTPASKAKTVTKRTKTVSKKKPVSK